MLDFIWVAEFNDGKVLVQYEDPKTQLVEHAFKEILDRQDDLVRFALMGVASGKIYFVNLRNGTMGVTTSGSGELAPDDDMLSDESRRYRLIYFRRVHRDFTYDLRDLGVSKTVYFMGFQFNDRDGKNHKRFMKIGIDGRLIIS